MAAKAKQATDAVGNAGEELWQLTAKRNPYGRVGVIEKGAMADLVIFSKNFMEDVSVIEGADNNLKLIVKAGKEWSGIPAKTSSMK